MFDNLIETKRQRVRGRTRALTMALVAHVVVFALVGIAQVWAVETVEPPSITVVFLSAAAPPPPPPPPAARKPPPKKPKEAPKPKPKPVPVVVPEIVQPDVVPDELPEKLDEEYSDAGFDYGVEGGVEGGIEGGVEGGFVGGVEGGVSDEPLRVGGDVTPPKIIKQVKPRYPEVAKAARVQGIVILEAVINASGQVEGVTVLRGHPLLEQAAKDAIVKWKFEPGKLNGNPVKVFFTLTVNFTLK